MKLFYTESFRRQYTGAPHEIQRAFDRRAAFLIKDLRHPSLRAKKYDERLGVWQARVTNAWRFYFTIEGDVYHLLAIIPHPK